MCGDVCAFLYEVEVVSPALKEQTESLEATQFSQVTSVMRVKCLAKEVACLKGENNRLKTSIAQQYQKHKRGSCIKHLITSRRR